MTHISRLNSATNTLAAYALQQWRKARFEPLLQSASFKGFGHVDMTSSFP
jgi:hypothetical protein